MDAAVLLLIIGLALYFVPGIIAGARGHNNFVAILVLNLFLGWTLLGWVGALVWACMNDVRGTAGERASQGPSRPL